MNARSHTALWPALALAVCLLLPAACGSSYQIAGRTEINRLDGKMLYLKALQGDSWVEVDSASVEHGLFAMSGIVDTTMIVTLFMDNSGLMPIILENGNIEVAITNSALFARGTPLNNSLYRFIDRRNAMEQKLIGLDRKEAQLVMDGEHIDAVRAKIAKEAEDIQEQMNRFILAFIRENYKNVLGAGVFIMLAQAQPYPIMTPLVEDIIHSAPAEFMANPMVQDYIEKARENMRLIEEHQLLRQNVEERMRAGVR